MNDNTLELARTKQLEDNMVLVAIIWMRRETCIVVTGAFCFDVCLFQSEVSSESGSQIVKPGGVSVAQRNGSN